MRLRPWSLMLLLGGCATVRPPALDESAVARLPAIEQQALGPPRAQLAEAAARVTRARDAREAARALVTVATSEAERRVNALPPLVGDLSREVQARAATDQLDWARRLYAARDAQLAEAVARQALAQATLDRAEQRALARHGLDDPARAPEFAAAEARAAQRVDPAARMAALRELEAAQVRTASRSRRRRRRRRRRALRR